MKKALAWGARNGAVDPRNRFAAAWVAAFLGVVLIIGAVFWAISALG